ncbi:MAG: Hpt domain-containing protein [Eubacterium sp.]|nr:Hpt domain-containing protein [Eubacterium sp.]
MITIEALREYGADVEKGLGRCMGNEALYLRLVGLIPAEENFKKLQEELDAKDLQKAFEAAHALKGVTGNLSLTPLYDSIVRITERLRAKEDTDYSEEMTEIRSQREKLEELCRQ